MTPDLSPHEQVKLASLIVSNKLQVYVSLNDQIYDAQATATSVLKTFLGADIPFKRFAIESAKMLEDWNLLIKSIAHFRTVIWEQLNDGERQYLASIVRICRCGALRCSADERTSESIL
jgi:hypothetical protein